MTLSTRLGSVRHLNYCIFTQQIAFRVDLFHSPSPNSPNTFLILQRVSDLPNNIYISSRLQALKTIYGAGAEGCIVRIDIIEQVRKRIYSTGESAVYGAGIDCDL